ncbi:hypothetical protein MMC07_001517 [Pseudocyphellaria aurata]|nr:hypothetical protein [Pseudocyphellaria aurata]
MFVCQFHAKLRFCLRRGKQCRCENKNQPPSTAKACEGQKKPDPVPAPSPLSFFDNNVGDTTDLDVSEEESVPPEQSTDQKSPVSFDGLDQYIQTATTQPSDIESSTGDVVALATDDANQNADQYGSQDISFGNGDVTWAAW